MQIAKDSHQQIHTNKIIIIKRARATVRHTDHTKLLDEILEIAFAADAVVFGKYRRSSMPPTYLPLPVRPPFSLSRSLPLSFSLTLYHFLHPSSPSLSLQNRGT